MDLLRILNNDTSNLDEEEIKIFNEFNEKLKDKIIDELIDYETNKISNLNNDELSNHVYSLFYNGIKGYRELTIKQLIDLYLTKKSHDDFINLLQK